MNKCIYCRGIPVVFSEMFRKLCVNFLSETKGSAVISKKQNELLYAYCSGARVYFHLSHCMRVYTPARANSNFGSDP